MILVGVVVAKDSYSFTRMSGDDPILLWLPTFRYKFYPHERGWSLKKKLQIFLMIVLPAWAGMILPTSHLG